MEPRPIAEALRSLMEERGFTFRSLEAATREASPPSGGLTNSYLNQLATGRATRFTAEAMEILASALDVPANAFLEYQSEVVRNAFDFRVADPDTLAERTRAFGEMLHRAPELQELFPAKVVAAYDEC